MKNLLTVFLFFTVYSLFAQSPENHNANTGNVFVSADKMNVLYVGTENPVTVLASGLKAEDVELSISGGGQASINGAFPNYSIVPKIPTRDNEMLIVTVSDKKSSAVLATYPFRVKRVPDPQVSLSNGKTGGVVTAGELKSQNVISANLVNFELEAKCQIMSFTTMYIPAGQDPQIALNSGEAFNEKTKELINNAKRGDIIIFQDIRARCNGDVAPRNLNALVFQLR